MNVIRKNILWLLVSQLATWGASVAVLFIVPNKLGSNDFGTFAYAVGYTQFFILAAGLGTSLYLSRAIARDYDLMGPYVWNAVLLKFALWAVLAPAALGLAYALGNRGQTLLLIGIGCVGMLPYILNEVFFGGLAGMQRMARPAMWTVVQVYFTTIFGILVLELGGNVVAYAIVGTLGIFIPMTATALMVRPFVRGHRAFDFRIWRLLVVGGIPLLTLTFLNLLYGSLDVPILHAIAGSEPVGWYGLAYRWVGIPLFITTAVVSAYFPSFSMHGHPLTREFAPLVNRAVHMVLFVTIPASVGLVFTAGDVIHLIYDKEYDPSIVLIQILAVGIPIIAMDTVLATALIASDRLKGYIGVAAVAACLNPIAAAFAIKFTDSRYGNGAIGAAIVTVATELWIMVGALHLRSPGVVDRAEVRRIGRIAAATAAMVPFLIVSARWPLAVQVILSIAAYAGASLAFGGITLAEMRDVIRRSPPEPGLDGLGDEPDGDGAQHEGDGSLTPVPPRGDGRTEP